MTPVVRFAKRVAVLATPVGNFSTPVVSVATQVADFMKRVAKFATRAVRFTAPVVEFTTRVANFSTHRTRRPAFYRENQHLHSTSHLSAYPPMKSLLFLTLLLVSPLTLRAELPAVRPEKVSTTSDLRQLLLTTKWTWRNVVAKVPDRECVFMPDGTFRHPNFVANFTIKDITTVVLTRKKDNKPATNTQVIHPDGTVVLTRRKADKPESAVMTFAPDYMSFEVVDFDKRRITGKRLPEGS